MSGARYKHVKSGGLYEHVDDAMLESTAEPFVIYRNCETGRKWLRPRAEFFDGRFVPVDVVFRGHLFCPVCHWRHVDEGEWAVRPHHEHLCAHCGVTWHVEPYVFGISIPFVEWDQMMLRILAVRDMVGKKPDAPLTAEGALAATTELYRVMDALDKLISQTGGVAAEETLTTLRQVAGRALEAARVCEADKQCACVGCLNGGECAAAYAARIAVRKAHAAVDEQLRKMGRIQ